MNFKDQLKRRYKDKTEFVFGDPGKEMVKFSLENRSDVIAMGNRGLKRLKEMFLDSVSNMVNRDIKCLVLLVK